MRIFIGRIIVWLMALFISVISAWALGAPVSFISHGKISALASILMFPGVLVAWIVFLDRTRAHGLSRSAGFRSALYGLVPVAILLAGFFFGFGPVTPKLLAPVDVDPPRRESRFLVFAYLGPAFITAGFGIFNEGRLAARNEGA